MFYLKVFCCCMQRHNRVSGNADHLDGSYVPVMQSLVFFFATNENVKPKNIK